jgi:hypothetical protein
MKTSAAMISMVLVLLSSGVAQSQTTMPPQSAPVAGGAQRRPVPPRPPVSAQHPGFAPHPGFVRQPFFAQSPAFVRRAGFPFRSGFVTNQIFIARGGVVAPWPYWYNYSAQAYAQPQYWAYCQNPEGYYPYVQECPGGWLAVVPTPPAPEWWRSSPDIDRQPMGGTSTEEIREQIERSRAESDAGLDLALNTAAGSRPLP